MFIIDFTCTRPDTSAPFYHDSDQAADFMSFIANLRTTMPGVEYVNSYTPDGLTYYATYTFDDASVEAEFTNTILAQHPTFFIDRDAYYLVNNHNLDSQVSGQ